ncbi:MAG TPA: hypothetical protein VF268_10730 [Gammaproteobacteria bacterium]
MIWIRWYLLLAVGLLQIHAVANAEPYLAVRSGLKCMACHTNPTGGGKRNEYGNIYAQQTLAAPGKNESGTGEPWTGSINRYLALGADFRGEFSVTDVPGAPDVSSEFIYEESLVYLQLQPLPGRLSLYVDHKLGPGNARTREAYGLLSLDGNKVYVKAGRFFLPFGFRLEDDDSFVRSLSAINYNTPDDGIELGYESGVWSAQLAQTNGAGGGAENNNEKRTSLNASYNPSGWRLGASFNSNETLTGEREMTAVYGGLRTGSVSWLFEYDLIKDMSGSGEVEQQVGLIEANTLLAQGSNLKLTYEILKPDSDLNEEDRNRISLIWEYFPVRYLQLNLGVRSHDGPESLPESNREQAFAQLHMFF